MIRRLLYNNNTIQLTRSYYSIRQSTKPPQTDNNNSSDSNNNNDNDSDSIDTTGLTPSQRAAKLELYRQLLPIRSKIQLRYKEQQLLLANSNNIVNNIPNNLYKMSTGPTIIDGVSTAKKVRAQLSSDIELLIQNNNNIKPCLAVVLVGERKDSQTYVNMKTKACNEVGITPVQHNLSDDITQDDLAKLVTELNNDTTVNGILIQLPLPSHINQNKIIELISHNKDVDGLTLYSAGSTYTYGIDAPLIACTPLGCITLLDEYNINISGKHAVVLGRSQLVGKPIASLLLSRNATVTMCHSKTTNIPDILKQADIIIAAIGKPYFVKREWLKQGCVVIDVGINAVDDKNDKRGYKLVGDVDYDNCKDLSSAITPVPGGVGLYNMFYQYTCMFDLLNIQCILTSYNV